MVQILRVVLSDVFMKIARWIPVIDIRTTLVNFVSESRGISPRVFYTFICQDIFIESHELYGSKATNYLHFMVYTLCVCGGFLGWPNVLRRQVRAAGMLATERAWAGVTALKWRVSPGFPPGIRAKLSLPALAPATRSREYPGIAARNAGDSCVRVHLENCKSPGINI